MLLFTDPPFDCLLYLTHHSFDKYRQAKIKLVGDVILFTDQSDELRVFSAPKLLSPTVKEIAPPPGLPTSVTSMSASSPPGSTSPVGDPSLLAKLKIYRIPSQGSCPLNVFLEYSDVLKLAFCCSAQVRVLDVD